MTADLRLVAHAADRQPDELAAERVRDRLAERGLADAGRADEAEDLSGDLVAELRDGEVLDDPVLDLLEVEVVGVEHRARVLEIEVVLGEGRPRAASGSTRDTCGSRRTRPRPAAASRAAAARGRQPCAPPRAARRAPSSRSRSSASSACSGSASPSSCWIAFSCWRRKYSRWPFSISDCTWDWIFEPSSNTSSSRLRIAETVRSRCSTSTSSRICWRSSVLIVRSVEATRWQSALGSSTFAAASCSSSGRYGARPMIRANRPWTFRVSASTSGVSSRTSGSALNSPSRYGSTSSRARGARARGPARGCAASRRGP